MSGNQFTCRIAAGRIDDIEANADQRRMKIGIKSVYEARSEQDGRRVLVDRLWPLGLTKEKAGVDLWLKEIGPSTELRKWFGHDPGGWQEFQKRYADEIDNNAACFSILQREVQRGPVTLLFGVQDEEHNEAVVLCSLLKKWIT
jgi:uncharacterized protein YeaO (DUF488 family)